MSITIVLGPPCDACGYVRRTTFEGLPDDVAEMLRGYVERSGLTKADISRRAGLATTAGRSGYLSALMAGEARPSRPVARDLIAALEMSWTDGERLLAASGSERDRRHRRAA